MKEKETDLLKTGRFTKSERVKRPQEIKTLFKDGQKVSIQGAKLFFLQNCSNINRIAFVLPHGYGNAVQRNRSKRLSREAYRYLKSHLNTGYDMLLLIYPGNDTFPSRCERFRSLCQKAGLLKK
ncbi:MAG: ribonuclease P protein component [Treponemataceae bacterium]|nr:ribonuclease P protein component [Treponemataceae bacterium]